MSSRPAKRARLNTDADAIGFSKIPELINSIDPNTIARLLIKAAKAYPDIASLVQREVDSIAATERAKVVDFDHLYQSVWETLNVTYARLMDSHAYEMAGEATGNIEACIREIRTGCPKTASFKTKENALETLRKIGKSICCSNEVVGREVRRGFQYDETFESTMLEIVESLTYEELERLRPWRDDKLVELQLNADAFSRGWVKSYCFGVETKRVRVKAAVMAAKRSKTRVGLDKKLRLRGCPRLLLSSILRDSEPRVVYHDALDID